MARTTRIRMLIVEVTESDEPTVHDTQTRRHAPGPCKSVPPGPPSERPGLAKFEPRLLTAQRRSA